VRSKGIIAGAYDGRKRQSSMLRAMLAKRGLIRRALRKVYCSGLGQRIGSVKKG